MVIELERASSFAPSVCPCKMAVVSPGLLVTKRSKDAHRRFELGLGEWTESSEDEKENDPPAPRKKLKLTLEKPKERWHFLTEVAESDLQQKLQNGRMVILLSGNLVETADLLVSRINRSQKSFWSVRMTLEL